MTKEQEEAIERCNKLIETEHSNWIGITNQKAIETVLNMLKEKDAEIEKYKQLYNKALDDAVITAHDNIKKDKMIDLMAEYISDLDIDEDICKKQSDNNCDDINREVECKECIKQYFERKVTYERKRQS